MSAASLLSLPFRWFDRATAKRDEREFLPAALEIIETPASPTSRLLGAVIIVFFVCAAAWAFIGRVDIMATAPGRVLPAGDVKIIQPLDAGVVRAIHVEDGTHVHAGQVLISLDPTQTSADRDRLHQDLVQARLDTLRLTALKQSLGTNRNPGFAPPADIPQSAVDNARAAMLAQANQQAARVADLTHQIAQKQAERAEVAAQTAKLQATLPLLIEKARIHGELAAQGYGTSFANLDAQQQVSEARHEIEVQAQRALQADSARVALERQRDGIRAQYAADVLSDLRKAEERAGELHQELVKATDKSVNTELRAPIDGVVEHLSIHTLGGVVTPAQHLMTIVPDGRKLIIEAQLANRDIGFVRAGQPAKIKIETFNFTRYGLLDGHVVSVSRDVIDPADRRSGDSAPSPAVASTQGSPAYVARIALNVSSLLVDGQRKLIEPGMVITAEIKTGDRTIIDYLFSPLARRAEEGLHER